MRLALAALLLVACTDDGPSDGGPGVTTHVESFQFASSMTERCFERPPADVDTMKAGFQYECSISETVGGVEKIFPQCNNANPAASTNKPCWGIILDAQLCAVGSNMNLHIERSAAPPDGVVKGQCLVQ